MKTTVITRLWLTADKASVVTGGPTKGYRWKDAGDEVTADEIARYGLVEGVHYRSFGQPAPRHQAAIKAPTRDVPGEEPPTQEQAS